MGIQTASGQTWAQHNSVRTASLVFYTGVCSLANTSHLPISVSVFFASMVKSIHFWTSRCHNLQSHITSDLLTQLESSNKLVIKDWD